MKRLLMILATLLLVLATPVVRAPRAIAQPAAVTDDNLDQAITSAKTPAEHEAIADYYDKEAARLSGYAKLHHSTHQAYEKFHMKPTGMAHHCDELAKSYQQGADQARALAADHLEMAKKAGAETGQ